MTTECFNEKNVSLPFERREAFFYNNDNDCGHICICVRNIDQLKRTFSSIFLPDNRKMLERKLQRVHGHITLHFEDKHNSLKIFQDCVLKLNFLTDHQKVALQKINECQRVLLNGRAGTGKTSLFVHRDNT